MSQTEKPIVARTDSSTPKLPGVWTFLWMFWMQPIRLNQLLNTCGINEPDARLFRLWRANEDNGRIRRQYVNRLLTILFLGMPAVCISIGIILHCRGGAFAWQEIAISIAIGGIMGIASAAVVGMATGSSFGFGLGIGTVIAYGVGQDLDSAIVGGLWVGMGTGIAGGIVAGRASMLGLVLREIEGWRRKGSENGGLAGSVIWFLSRILEVVTYILCVPGIIVVMIWHGLWVPLELTVILVAPTLARQFRCSQLRFSPVQWHDLTMFPLPSLRQELLDEAATNPSLVREILVTCDRSFAQEEIGKVVRSILKVREWRQHIEIGNFASASELRGEWLAGNGDPDLRLQLFAEAAKYLRAADVAVVARHRLQQLERTQEILNSLRDRLLKDRSREVFEFGSALDVAEMVTRRFLRVAIELAADQLPNPFQAGNPLSPEFDLTMFRGREDLVRQIELLLNDERQAAAVSLIAPRRCGKSSLLRMLPVKIPDSLCVFFDLQDNPITTPFDLFPALEKRLLEQARPQERESLPRLRDSSLEAARDWLEALEQRPGRDRVLLCLDEFERLEEVVGEKPETKQQLVQLMGLLRATIQHRRRVRILVAGNATFEELGPLWNDSFISARELRLGPLEREVAIGLLRQPIPISEGFPEDAVPQDVAEAIVDRTGGQPYLTQLYGFWLVEELNKTKRKIAELKDVEAVDQIVFEQAAPFFRDSLKPRGATFEVRPVIEQIVAGIKPDLTPNQTRFLARRGLISAEGTLAFPILGRWLNESAE